MAILHHKLYDKKTGKVRDIYLNTVEYESEKPPQKPVAPPAMLNERYKAAKAGMGDVGK